MICFILSRGTWCSRPKTTWNCCCTSSTVMVGVWLWAGFSEGSLFRCRFVSQTFLSLTMTIVKFDLLVEIFTDSASWRAFPSHLMQCSDAGTDEGAVPSSRERHCNIYWSQLCSSQQKMTGVFLYIFFLIVPVFYEYKALWQVLSFDKQTWSIKRLNIRIYTYIVFISLMVARGMLIGLAKKIEKSFKETVPCCYDHTGTEQIFYLNSFYWKMSFLPPR